MLGQCLHGGVSVVKRIMLPKQESRTLKFQSSFLYSCIYIYLPLISFFLYDSCIRFLLKTGHWGTGRDDQKDLVRGFLFCHVFMFVSSIYFYFSNGSSDFSEGQVSGSRKRWSKEALIRGALFSDSILPDFPFK